MQFQKPIVIVFLTLSCFTLQEEMWVFRAKIQHKESGLVSCGGPGIELLYSQVLIVVE